MKKILALLLACLMVASLFAGCQPADNQGTNPPTNSTITNPDQIADEMTSKDGKYQVAFITDVGQLKDKSFNQGTYDGVKLYAAANGKSYKYYQPANGDQATDDDRKAAFDLACANGAEIVVAAGFMQEAALVYAAEKYPDIHFVFIDGYPIGFDNVAEAKLSTPPLTTFNVNKTALDKRLVSILLDRIANPTQANQIIYIASKKVIRSSS